MRAMSSMYRFQNENVFYEARGTGGWEREMGNELEGV